MNQIILVGRLVNDVTLGEPDNGKQHANITIAISRNYKNEEGEYETDFVNCVLSGNIAGNTAEYCKKGDVLGIKGNLQTKTIETDSGDKNTIMEVIVDRITFLSNAKTKEENIDDINYDENIKI